MPKWSRAVTSVLLFFAACEGTVDLDASVARDAGGTRDAGGPRDAGPRVDAPVTRLDGGVVEAATFPLAPSPNRRFFVDASGRPFLLRGDSAWSLAAELTKEDALVYLDDRAARGFNAILFSLIEANFSSNDPTWENREGEVPFTDMDDWTTVNETYFEHVDWLLDRMAERGMLALIAPAYIGYGCGTEGWCARMRTNGATRLRAYGEFVGERYRDVPNILWVEAGDHAPAPSDMLLVEAVVDGITEGDAGGHLHTAHWTSGTSGSEIAVDWLDVDSTYAYEAPHLYPRSLADYARSRGTRPVFLFESYYENEHATSRRALRSQMYQPMLAGSTGFNFGNFPVWAFWDPGDDPWFLDDGGFPLGWESALSSPGTRDATIAGDFFASLAWQELEPDTAHTVMTAGFGTFGDDDYVLAASTPDGSLAVAYYTARLDPTVDLDALSVSPVRARWFDPSDGSYRTAAGSPFVGEQTFEPPGANAEGTDDWVLVLDGG